MISTGQLACTTCLEEVLFWLYRKTFFFLFWMNIALVMFGRNEMMLAFGECNWTRAHNHLVRKRTINHLAKFV